MTTSAMEANAEEITTDDLQAMKAMIGDIKKDPSLLFRLTSLSIGVSNLSGAPSATTFDVNTSTANGDVTVDDDTTVVSALTLPSIGDWNTVGNPQHQLPHGVVGRAGERVGNSSSTVLQMGCNEYQSASTFARATATAVARTNHDAEIALRIQSLRAQRSITNNRRTIQSAGGNSQQQIMSTKSQHTTPQLKTIPSNATNGGGGRMLVRTPSSASNSSYGDGGTKLKTNNAHVGNATAKNFIPHRNSNPGAMFDIMEGGGDDYNEERKSDSHILLSNKSSKSLSEAKARAIVTAAGSSDLGNGVGYIPRGSRRQRKGQNATTDDMHLEKSKHSGALVLYQDRSDAQAPERHQEMLPSQTKAGRGNRNVEQNNAGTDLLPRERSSELSTAPSDSLAQYCHIPSSKTAKVQNMHMQQSPSREESNRSRQPTSTASNSRGSNHQDSKRGRKAQSRTDEALISPCSKALNVSFSSSSPTLLSGGKDNMSDHSGLNSNAPSFHYRGHSVSSGNHRGSDSARNSYGREDPSSDLDKHEQGRQKSSSSHRSKHKNRNKSLPHLSSDSAAPTVSPAGDSKSCADSPLEKQNHLHSINSDLPENMNNSIQWFLDDMNDSSEKIISSQNNNHKKTKGTRVRAESEPAVISSAAGFVTEGDDRVSTLVNDHHQSSVIENNDQDGQQRTQSPQNSQSSLGHRLTQLSMLDRSRQHHDQRSDRSESGRSVISRLFSPVKRSVSSYDGYGGTEGNSLFDSDQFHPFSTSAFSKSQGGAKSSKSVNEHPSSFEEITDGHHIAVLNHDTLRKSSEHRQISNGDLADHMALGIKRASGSVHGPHVCDERGRCQFHPHIRLLKPKMFGGWKILLQYCPDCVLEQLKKNQENLTRLQQQQKKEEEKKRRRIKKDKERQYQSSKYHADPIIGKDVGYAESDEKMENRQHMGKDSEKQLQESRQADLPSPSEDIQNKDTTVQVDQQLELEQGISGKQDGNEQAPSPETPLLSTDSIVPHKELNSKRVNGLPWIDYNGNSGRYTGAVNEQYLPHGQGVMIYDRGSISAGIWYNGVLDTEDSTSRCLVDVPEVAAPKKNEHIPPRVLAHYTIGDTGRIEHMIIDTKKVTAALVSEIRVGDAAFVCRTDGRWTYAIAKGRTYGENPSIKFKVNIRGSTKEFPSSQWGGFVRPVQQQQQRADDDSAITAKSNHNSTFALGDFLDSHNGGSNSVAGNCMRQDDSDGDASIISAQSAPNMMNNDLRSRGLNRSMDNLTTAKMKIPSRSRSRSRSRHRRSLSTSFPTLLSSDMSVREENVDGQVHDVWETASGSGYRLRGIDP